jgi:argonaute-like protein implicated in RNA metabolism and viral defense
MLCFHETQIKNIEAECIVALTNHKFFVLSYYDGHDTIMFYDANNTLNIHMKHIKKMLLKLL